MTGCRRPVWGSSYLWVASAPGLCTVQLCRLAARFWYQNRWGWVEFRLPCPWLGFTVPLSVVSPCSVTLLSAGWGCFASVLRRCFLDGHSDDSLCMCIHQLPRYAASWLACSRTAHVRRCWVCIDFRVTDAATAWCRVDNKMPTGV